MNHDLKEYMALLDNVIKSIDKYKFKIKKLEDEITTSKTFLELEERKLLQLKDEIKRLGGELDEIQENKTFSIEETLEIIKLCPEGANLQKILDTYKFRGVYTYFKIIRNHVDTLIEQDRIYPADVWKKKGIKYLAR